MGLDLRWPIGLMFTLFGLMLSITGLFEASNAEMWKPSLGINIDLWWGLLLLVFGVFMLAMAKKGAKSTSQPSEHQDASSNPQR